MKQPLILALTAATAALYALPAQAWQVTWLGHSGFVVEAKNGTRLLIDPWLANPKFPKNYALPARVDAILITHGHFDHAGSATELSTRYHAPIVGCFELVNQLQPKGVPGIGGNVGGTLRVKGVDVSLIPAVHSSSLSGENGAVTYAGAPVGFVLRAKGEKTLLHAGDTGLTRDYEAVREVFHPQIAMLPIGGYYTMDPPQAAIAARYLGVGQVVPMHYGTFPLLTGTPAALRRAVSGMDVTVRELKPGIRQTL